ncbi:cell division site-positioning protein MapZ family protein [Streptococcus sp. 4886]|uniref:cell division site-positioning protein MapZ n=1 Tax=Streptococcus sp. 4886 TaxID=2582682 RepID=UPI001563475F|nr:cell division site-positioning protein MapZ family protein [Streptococcus sp. 4886]
MSKKRRNRHKKENQEPQKENQEPRFDFDEAKELTVGQAIRKNEEVEAGVLPEDSILDKYVKQHRDEIEADKFATRQYKKEELVETQSLDDLIQEVREAVEESEASSEEVPSSEDILPPLPLDDEEQDLDPLLLEDENPTEMTEEVEEEQSLSRLEQEDSEKKSKKGFVLTVLALVSVIICVSAYYVYRQVNRSTQEIQTSQSSSSEQNVQPILEDFNSQYDAFYTDSNKTALKNSQFDKLSQLKTLLDKLEGSREHTLAKSKYDSLATQIKAIQDVNAQFEKPAIVNGVLDTNAKAKSDAKFTEIKTGNTEIDKVLDKAISLGKSQQTSTSSSSSSSSQTSSSSSSQASSNTTSETSPSSSNAASNETRSSRSEVNMGVSSAGVAVQRSASRVAYNQSAIDDSNNSAWDFADGVLEQILATSRSRGYITGDQYILERVNIVNGNGYYNLYKPDGTYLFTLNCKTGYFVGNGAGHADDLDY